MMCKTIPLIFLLLFSGICLKIPFRFGYKWSDFKKDFGSLLTPDQVTNGQPIFTDNYLLLSDFFSKDHDVLITIWLVVKVFLQDEIPEPVQNPSDPQIVPETKILNIDYRRQLKVTRVKNQGSKCGSCWTFASMGVLESMYSIVNRGYLYQGSTQYFLQCSYLSVKGGWDGCKGGFSGRTPQMIKQNGFYQPPQVQKYPYKQDSRYFLSRGQPICDPSKNGMFKTKKIPFILQQYISTSAKPTTIKMLENIVVQNGPVTATINTKSLVFKSIGYTGKIRCTKDDLGSHSVLIVGYTQQHWIIKNSHGLGWGNNGYGYVDKNYDCGIKNIIVSVRAINYPQPPPSQNVTLKIKVSCPGFSGAIIGLRKDNDYFFDFGRDKSGLYSVITNGKEVIDVFVQEKGSNPQTVQFTIFRELNYFQRVKLFQFKRGSMFEKNQILGSFCAIKPCNPIKTVYQYFMFLKRNDRFEQSQDNSMVIVVDGIRINIIRMLQGTQDGPYLIDANLDGKVQIQSNSLNPIPWKVSFQVKNVYKKVIISWKPTSIAQIIIKGQVLASWIANNSN